MNKTATTYESYLHGKLGLGLTISYIPNERSGRVYSVSFPAFLESLNDSFSSDWNQEAVYGRMDPIATFTGTQRSISVTWTVPSKDQAQAATNLAKIDKLISFMYPKYDDEGGDLGGGTGAINAAPMLKVKFANLICNVRGGGLLCFVDGGLNVEPILEEGFFHDNSGKIVEMLYPQSFRLSMTLKVIHEHRLGYNKHNNLRMASNPNKPANIFPYMAGFETGSVDGNRPDGEPLAGQLSLPEFDAQTGLDGHVRLSTGERLLDSDIVVRVPFKPGRIR